MVKDKEREKKMLDKGEYYHVVQHIFDVPDCQTIGFEVLLRHESLINPELLFQNARSQGNLVELDLLSIMKFLTTNHSTLQHSKVFFNIFPSTLASSKVQELFSWVEEMNEPNIVLELNESNDDQLIWGSRDFMENVQYARELGIEIAMDDVGKGQATLSNIKEIKPDYIKMDRSYGFNLARSEEKKQIVAAYIDFATSSRIPLVLEGVETEDDYEVAKQVGVQYMQGYYLGRPQTIKQVV